MIDLKGKIALLTASGQGIGKATARAFSKAGAYVIATDINRETLSSLDKIVDETHILDVTDNNAIKNLVGSIKEPDILFNCAGIVHNGTILESTDNDWDMAFTLNAKAMYHMIKEVLPIMITKGGGSIVNIASVSGKDGNAKASAYSSSKAGVIALTKSLGKELADKNIAVNVVTPAGAKTRILNQMSKEHVKRMLSKVPRARFLKLNELSSMVCWLSSEENSFSTAAVFDISGGRSTY